MKFNYKCFDFLNIYIYLIFYNFYSNEIKMNYNLYKNKLIYKIFNKENKIKYIFIYLFI